LSPAPTGSGKSTTLAALIDYINKNREEHIITIEDPIEFVHHNNKCLINQREVHVHTQASNALWWRLCAKTRHRAGRRNARPGNDSHRD
jgi:twitching motility protein PilT